MFICMLIRTYCSMTSRKATIYMNTNPNQSKNEIYCFGGDVIQHIIAYNEYVFKAIEINPILLEEASLLIVDEGYHDLLDESTNGRKLIFKLRLEHSYSGPIVLISGKIQSEDDKYFKQVFEDPLVSIIELEEFVALLKKGKEEFLGKFDPTLSKEERELLYFDLRQTLYRSGRYMYEMRHKLLRTMAELEGSPEPLVEAKKLLVEHEENVKQVIDTWKPTVWFNAVYVRDKFASFMDIEDISILKSEVANFFDAAENLIKNKEGAHKNEEEVKLVYVTSDEVNTKRLNALLQEIAPNMNCLWAATDEDAIRLIKDHPNLTTVLSDYRFRSPNSNRIEAINGFIILERIRKIFTHQYYAFLTNIGHLPHPTPLGIGPIDYYDKNQTLSSSTAGELHRLVEQARQHKNTIRQRTLPWPEKISQSKNAKRWAALYFEEMGNNPNVAAIEQEIGSKAASIVVGLLGGKSATELNIPSVAGLLINLKRPSFKEDLMPRLIMRRVILALLNCKGLGEKKFSAEAKRFNKKTYSGKNRSFGIVYLILRGSENIDTLDSKIVSNFFSDNFILYTSRDYKQPDSACSQGFITTAENLWLASNMPLFNL